MDSIQANTPWPSLSHTSMRTYEGCQRAWLYKYGLKYLEKFMEDTDAFWILRREAKLSPDATYAGSIVHKVISEGMHRIYVGGVWWEDSYERAKEIGREMIAFSERWVNAVARRETWPRDGQPMERVYFGEPWTYEEGSSVRSTIKTCLRNFEGNDVIEVADNTPREAWQLPPDGIPPLFSWTDPSGSDSFIPMRGVFDFALHSDVETIIWDWKAGASAYGGETVLDQLHLYAGWAIQEWGVLPERIKLIPLWLKDGGVGASYDLSMDRLQALWHRYRELQQALIERGLNMENGADPFKLFQATDDHRRCSSCQFRSCPERSLPSTETQ